MFFSNFVSSSNFSASILLFILIYSNCSSKGLEILGICFYCIMNFYENLSCVSFTTLVASESHSVSGLGGNISFPIVLYY